MLQGRMSERGRVSGWKFSGKPRDRKGLRNGGPMSRARQIAAANAAKRPNTDLASKEVFEAGFAFLHMACRWEGPLVRAACALA